MSSTQVPLRWLKPGECNDLLPVAVASSLGEWPTVAAIGPVEILRAPLLALFCSLRCPGELVLETYDLARALREGGVAVVSGFHTPMEKECLELLLRGRQPVVMCPARGIEGMRLPPALKTAIESGRMLLLSPFGQHDRRPTARLADERNRFVAALASEVFIAYANRGGRTEQLCRHLLAAGKPVSTFDAPGNAPLIEMGCTPTTIDQFLNRWTNRQPPQPPSDDHQGITDFADGHG